MTPVPTDQHQEEERTSIARMSAVIPHSPFYTPKSTILRDSSICGIALMTTQHVTAKTKLSRQPAHFRQHHAQVHCATRKVGVHRRVLSCRIPRSGSSSHVESIKEVRGQMKLQVHNILHECGFICGCKRDNVCTFSCNMWVGRRRPISHRDVIVDNWQKRCLVTQQIQRERAR